MPDGSPIEHLSVGEATAERPVASFPQLPETIRKLDARTTQSQFLRPAALDRIHAASGDRARFEVRDYSANKFPDLPQQTSEALKVLMARKPSEMPDAEYEAQLGTLLARMGTFSQTGFDGIERTIVPHSQLFSEQDAVAAVYPNRDVFKKAVIPGVAVENYTNFRAAAIVGNEGQAVEIHAQSGEEITSNFPLSEYASITKGTQQKMFIGNASDLLLFNRGLHESDFAPGKTWETLREEAATTIPTFVIGHSILPDEVASLKQITDRGIVVFYYDSSTNGFRIFRGETSQKAQQRLDDGVKQVAWNIKRQDTEHIVDRLGLDLDERIKESAVSPNQEQANISPIVFKAKRGQSVEVTPEGGYRIHLPWWDRLRMRIESARKKHVRGNSESFFTSREIRQILKHPEKPYTPKGIDRILRHSFAYIQAIEGAPSSVPGMKIWDTQHQMRQNHPEGLAQLQKAKAVGEEEEIPLHGRRPLSPEQEAYLQGITRRGPLNFRDIDALRRVLEEANYRNEFYQRYAEHLQSIKPVSNTSL